MQETVQHIFKDGTQALKDVSNYVTVSSSDSCHNLLNQTVQQTTRKASSQPVEVSYAHTLYWHLVFCYDKTSQAIFVHTYRNTTFANKCLMSTHTSLAVYVEILVECQRQEWCRSCLVSGKASVRMVLKYSSRLYHLVRLLWTPSSM